MPKLMQAWSLFVFSVLLAAGGAAFSQTTPVPTGQIIERLACLDNPEQSYALYLPPNYTSTQTWPVLYAFDPAARGKLPVERFREAAEEYGWILVGSNNSRNGPMGRTMDAAKAMWKDTHERFAIDERQTYATGFSGGARVAILVASSCHDCIAGVIASGAGFPVEIKPSASTHFLVFATAGIEDFNLPEIKSLGETLTRAGVTNHIEVFVGRHEWPSTGLAMEAIEWLTLQAMKRGARPHDGSFIAEVWSKKLAQAKNAEASKQFYEAYQIYSGLADTFNGLRAVSEAEKRSSDLRSTREVKQALSDERNQFTRQRELERQINDLIYQREGNTEEIDIGPRLSALVAEIRKSAKAEQDSSERRVARRVSEGLFVLFFEQGRDLLQYQKRYDEAVKKLSLATELIPDRAGVFVMLASAYALKGDKKKALQTLKTAVEKGFSDSAALANNKSFDSLRNDPQYQQLIQNMKSN